MSTYRYGVDAVDARAVPRGRSIPRPPGGRRTNEVVGATTLLCAVAGESAALLLKLGRHTWVIPVTLAAVLAIAALSLPRNRRLMSFRPVIAVVFLAAASALAVASTVEMSARPLRNSLAVVGATVVPYAALVLAMRHHRRATRIVLVGDEQSVGETVVRMQGWNSVAVVAVCLTDAGHNGAVTDEVFGVAVGGGVADVPDVVARFRAAHVVVTSGTDPAVTRRIRWGLSSIPGLPVSIAVQGEGIRPSRARTGVIAGQLVVCTDPPIPSPLLRAGKQFVDRLAAAVLLIVFAPVLILLMLVIRGDSPGRAIYAQTRVGANGRPFRMYKLRSMTTDADRLRAALAARNEGAGPLFKMARDPRITRVGGFLRKSSLDELPQLWNVVRGEMSLIGPRPALPDEVAQYDDRTRRRLAVRPGLTGLWQVSGRSSLAWDDAVRLDLDYVDNMTVRDEAAIAVRTVRAVIRRDGAY